MDWLGAFSIVVVFVLLLQLFKVVSSSKQVVSLAGTVMGVIKDPNLTDLEKEKSMQRYSIELLRFFVVIGVGCALALAIPLGLIWGFDFLGLMSFDRVMAITLSWQFILATSVLGCLGYFAAVKARG